jgi:hypothetical protein
LSWAAKRLTREGLTFPTENRGVNRPFPDKLATMI